jgi:hypothetical protein
MSGDFRMTQEERVFDNMCLMLQYMASGQRKSFEAPCTELKTLKVPAKRKFIKVIYKSRKEE